MELRTLFAMQVAMMAAGYIAASLFVPYLVSLGYSQLDVVLYDLSIFAFTLCVLMLVRNWRMKDYLSLGLGTRILAFGLAFWLSHPPLLWLSALLVSLMITDYWAVFNTLFEDETASHNRAFLNSAILGIAPVIGIFVPPIAGYVADHYGFGWLFIAGIVAMLPALWLARKAGGKRMKFDFAAADAANQRIREVMLLEGFGDGVIWGIPALVTLTFVSTNLEFGGFLAYLALAGVASSLVLGKLSDSRGARARYITPVMLLNGGSLVLAGIANDIWVWAIAMGLNSFLINIEWPFTWAMVTESTKDVGAAMVAREFWLNAGRMLSLVFTVALVLFGGSVQLGLVGGGVALMLFPVAMRLRRLG